MQRCVLYARSIPFGNFGVMLCVIIIVVIHFTQLISWPAQKVYERRMSTCFMHYVLFASKRAAEATEIKFRMQTS